MIVMSSMKAETCDPEHRTYPATHVDGVPTTTTAAGWHKRDFVELYQSIYINLVRKKYVFWLILFKE